MARLFTGASSNVITLSIGALSAVTSGTFAVICKRTTDGAWHSLVALDTSANAVGLGVELSDTNKINLRLSGTDTLSPTFTVTAADSWVLVVVTKAAGTATPRFHKYVFSTSTWTHENGSAAVADGTAAGVGGNVKLGSLEAATGDFFDGTMSASAVWSTVLTDTQIETLSTNLTKWTDLSPAAMWVLDQASTATAVQDRTAGGANQTAITGTAVASGDPITFAGDPLGFRAGTQGFGAASSVVLTIPATVKTGDMMVITACLKQLTGSGTINTPTGWTVRHAPVSGPSGNSMQGAVFVKTAAGTTGAVSSEAGATVTINATAGSQQLTAVFAAYAGVDSIRSSAWVVGSTTSATSLTCAAPATGAQTGDLVVYLAAVRETVNGPVSQPTFTAATGDGTVRAQTAGTSGSAQNVASFIGDDDSANATRTVTASQTSVAITGQIVLIPAAANVALDRATSESLTAGDAMARSLALVRAQGEGVTLGNTMSAGVVLARAPGEALALGNTLAAVSAKARGQAEALALGNTLAATRAQNRGTAETLTASGAWAYTAGRSIGVAEALHLVGAVASALAAPRGVAQSLTLTAGVSTGLGVTIAVLEGLTLAAGWARQLTASRGVGEGASLDSAATPTVALLAGTTESLTFTDDWFAGRVVLLATAETVGIADAVSRAATAYDRPVGEALTLGHTFDRLTGQARVVAQPITVADGWARSGAAARAVPQTVTLTDSWGRTRAGGRAIAETLTLGHTFGRQLARARSWAETISLVDAVTGGRFVQAAMAESVSLVDAVGRAAGYARAVAETLTLGHTFGRQLGRVRAAAEAIAMVDEMVASRQIIPVTMAIDLAFSDQNSARTARARGLAETVDLASLFTRQAMRYPQVGEHLTLGGLLDISTAIQVAVNIGALTLDDRNTHRTALRTGWAQGLLLTDVVARTVDTSIPQPPVAYPHFVTMAATMQRVEGTVVFDNVRRTI